MSDWVQFTDRTPTHGVEVLVWRMGRTTIGYYDRNTDNVRTLHGVWTRRNSWWQPLPERPQESGTETANKNKPK